MPKPQLKPVENQNTLIALAAEANELTRLLFESGGELTPELEDRLTINSERLLAKTDNYKFLLDELENQEAIWKSRRDQAAQVEKQFASLQEKVKERLLVAMKTMNADEVRGNMFRFKVQKSAPSIAIDEAKIPQEYKMVIQTTVVDKEKIKALVKDGFNVPGVTVTQGEHIRTYTAAKKD